VHRADGEWLGECDCMKVAQPNEPAQPIYQYLTANGWEDVTKFRFDDFIGTKRIVYTAPPNLEEANKLLEAKIAELTKKHAGMVDVYERCRVEIDDLKVTLEGKSNYVKFLEKANKSHTTFMMEQKSQIAELEAHITILQELSDDLSKSIINKGHQIAELTAKVEKMREALVEISYSHDGYANKKAKQVLEECK